MSEGTARVTCMFGSLPVEFGGEGRGGVAVHTGKIAEALAAVGESVTVVATEVAPGTEGFGSNGHSPSAGRSAPFGVIGYSQPRKGEASRLLLRGHQIAPPRGLPSQAALGWQEAVWLRPAGYRYWDLIRDLKPQIVHVHGVGLTALAVQRAASRLRAPLVLTVHSLRGHVPDDVFFGRSVPSLFVADAVITVSKHLKMEAASYGVDESRIHVIVNGVDRSYFVPVARDAARRALGITDDGPIVLLVAHLIERKGGDIAIRAMQKVVAQIPSARLFLIGGPQDYTDPVWLRNVRELPRVLGIEQNVVFVGDIPGHTDNTLNLWYNAADAVVLPSRAEGMGMVLTEGMACGKPVIGARVGGIQDVIRDGVNGLLTEPESPEGLAAALLDVFTNPELAGRLSQAGIRHVATEHDWRAIARQTQEVYSDVRERGGVVTRRRWAVPRAPSVTRDATPTLKLYADKSFLPPGANHVAMLAPFWGNSGEDPKDPSRGWLDRYLEVGNQFFQMTRLDEADLAVLPAQWARVIETATDRARAKEFAARARAAGAPTVVFFNSDSTGEVPIEGSLVFRTSLYRSRRRPNEFAIPAWSEDFVATYLDGELPIRQKPERATVGFCGYATPLMSSWVRNIARWGAGLAGLRTGDTNPFVRPGHAVRLRAMKLLSQTADVGTSFVRRDNFFGAAASEPGTARSPAERLRREYVRNMVDSDYTLCVRGAGNFSYRLYETLSCGRIPVFVDTDCVLPYDSIVDWRRFCVYIDESELQDIGRRVAEFHASLSDAEFERMQRDCRKLWEEWISPQGFFRNFHRHLENATHPR